MQRDKRTFQIASSLRRLGCAPTVVEGEPSSLERRDLPFELVTVAGAEALRDPIADGGSTAEPLPEPGPGPAEEANGSHPLVAALPGPLSSALSAIGAAIHRLRHRGRLLRMLVRGFRRDNRLTLEALPAAELYYLTFFWQFPAVRKACRRHGAVFVYDANDAYWEWPAYQWYPAAFRGLLRWVERRCVGRAAGFITVSEGVAHLLEQRYGRRPEVVRNLHDLRVDEDGGPDIRRGAGLTEEDFLLVVTGNEKPSDAVRETIQALTKVSDRVHLALMGRGYEKHLPDIRRLDLEDRVHLVPPVPPTQVTGAIRRADAGLINIRARGVHLHALPTRLFSTVAAGLPILYPPLPEVRALAEDYRLGEAVDAEDPDSIAAAVRRLSDDAELTAEYRANVERAREELNWEREESKLGKIIDSALTAQ